MNRLVAVYNGSVLQWRLAQDGNWMGPAVTGDLATLKRAQEQSGAEIWLAVSAQQLVITREPFDESQKKHLAKLMPYELEDNIIGDVDDFHFAYGVIKDNTVTVAYTPMQWLSDLFEAFSEHGLDVVTCLPEPLMLPWEEGQWSLRWLGEQEAVEVRYGYDLCFSVDMPLLGPALAGLMADPELPTPQQCNLLAPSFELLSQLAEALPESLRDTVVTEQWDRWLSLSLDAHPALNLRQQTLGRSLPLERYWKSWRQVAVVALVAGLLSYVVNWAEFMQLQSEHKANLAEVERVYRSVIPKGRLQNAEVQLRNQLKKYKTQKKSTGPSPLILLSKITPLLAKNQSLKVKNMTFNGGEIRMNLEAPTFQLIETLRSDLEKQQLTAQLLNSSAKSDGHQARLKIGSRS